MIETFWKPRLSNFEARVKELERQRDELYWASLDLPMLTWNDEDSGKRVRRFNVALSSVAADLSRQPDWADRLGLESDLADQHEGKQE